jgi:hypothetical protein
MRYHGNPTVNSTTITTTSMKAPKQMQTQLLRLQVSNGVNNDEAVLYVNPNASNTFDNYDSPKKSNNSASIPEIYTQIGNEQLVINGLNAITLDKELPLGFTSGEANTYSIKATEIDNFDAGIQIILRDNQNNTEWNLTDGSPYIFNSDITAPNINRFSLIFKSASVSTGIEPNLGDLNSILVYRNFNNQIVVNIPNEIIGKANVSVYNTVGQKLENTLLNSSVSVMSNLYFSGVYFVSVVAKGRVITRRVVIN